MVVVLVMGCGARLLMASTAAAHLSEWLSWSEAVSCSARGRLWRWCTTGPHMMSRPPDRTRRESRLMWAVGVDLVGELARCPCV